MSWFLYGLTVSLNMSRAQRVKQRTIRPARMTASTNTAPVKQRVDLRILRRQRETTKGRKVKGGGRRGQRESE